MPARTRNLTPVIVYLEPETSREVERQAKELDRSISYVARGLVKEALEWRKGDAVDEVKFLGRAEGWAVWEGSNGWHWWARYQGNIDQGVESKENLALVAAQHAYGQLTATS